MESSVLPEKPEFTDGPILCAMQDSATSCTIENTIPQDVIANEQTFSVNNSPAVQGLDRDGNKSSAQEASITLTSASQATAEKPPADEKHVPQNIWCRLELNDLMEQAKHVMPEGPGGKERYRLNFFLQAEGSTVDHSAQREDDQNPTLSPNTASIKYSNRFLDIEDRIVTVESWPEALDLDRERGKPAGGELQHHQSIIELVTIVRTNIDMRMMMHHHQFSSANTRGILFNPKVTADFARRELVIGSLRIVNAFKATITYYPGLELRGVTMTIPEPYCVFYHYYQELKALQKAHDSSSGHLASAKEPETTPTGPQTHNLETREHLKILFDFLECQNFEDVELERKRHLQNPPVATYRMMWLLFKPGIRVYHFSGGRAVAGVVISIETDSVSQRPGLRSLDFWTLDFDGFKLGRREVSHNFRPFDGEKLISDLPICPCDIFDAQDNNCLRDKLISRGKKFWKFLPGAQVDYEGKLPNEGIEWVSLFLCPYLSA